MPNKIETAADTLETQIAHMKAELSRLAEQMVALGKQDGAALSAAAREQAETLRAKGVAGLAGAEGAVKDHPLRAVGIAAALGLLFGLILGRR